MANSSLPVVSVHDLAERFIVKHPHRINLKQFDSSIRMLGGTPMRRPLPPSDRFGAPSVEIFRLEKRGRTSKPARRSSTSQFAMRAISAQVAAGGIMCDDSDTEDPVPMKPFYRRGKLVFRCSHREKHEFIIDVDV